MSIVDFSVLSVYKTLFLCTNVRRKPKNKGTWRPSNNQKITLVKIKTRG